MGFGTAVMTAQYWGKRELTSIRKAVSIMYRICIVLALLFTVVTILFPDIILRIYTGDEEVIAYGCDYYKWLGYAYLFQGLSTTTTIVLRSVGEMRVPMVASIIGAFTNLCLNWVFIFGHFGVPEMQIGGAALATLIARIAECAIIMCYFLCRDRKVQYKMREIFRPVGGIYREYLRLSVPALISDLLLAFGNNAVSVVMGQIGTAFVAANAITTMTMQLTTVFAQGVANASSMITGNTLGEGKYDDAQEQGVTFLAISIILGIVSAVVIKILSPYIIGYYNIEESTRAIAQQLMDAIAIVLVFQMIGAVMTKGVLRGGGDTKFLMVADILFLWVLSLPLGYMAGLVWFLEPFWISVCLRSDRIVKAVWSVSRLLSRKWIRIARTDKELDAIPLQAE